MTPEFAVTFKHDGYRMIARARAFSRIAEAVAALPVDVLLDGEAVVFHPDGHSDFGALRRRAGGSDAVMVVFDVLEVDGRDLRAEPLERRRSVLIEILRGANDGLVLSETIEGDGQTIFRHACAMGLEGIVSKRTGSKYRSGRSGDWLKTKNAVFVRR